MSQRRLTVQVDVRWIEPAKRYAARHQTTLSRLISTYLRSIAEAEEPFTADTPILDRLSGILASDVDWKRDGPHRELPSRDDTAS